MRFKFSGNIRFLLKIDRTLEISKQSAVSFLAIFYKEYFMFFQTWSDFFNMGGYGFYVWLSYVVSLVAVIALIVQSVKQRKTVLQNVLREQQREERLQQANKGNTL